MPYKDKKRQKEAQAVWYQENKKSSAENKQRYRKERAIWFLELKRQLSCVECGESHPACIEFHHNDETKKFKKISDMVHEPYNEERILDEIKKCKILCGNCHKKHHWKTRTDRHAYHMLE